jgi:hypothetical protein
MIPGIKDIKASDKQISKVYAGDKLVWQKLKPIEYEIILCKDKSLQLSGLSRFYSRCVDNAYVSKINNKYNIIINTVEDRLKISSMKIENQEFDYILNEYEDIPMSFEFKNITMDDIQVQNTPAIGVTVNLKAKRPGSLTNIPYNTLYLVLYKK